MSNEPTYGVMSGPSRRMKQEIGEIVIAHANCDPMLAALMQSLTKTDERTCLMLIQQLKLKGSSMAEFIFSAADTADHIDPVIRDRIRTMVQDYRRLSLNRNEIAHWQWNLSEPGAESALLRNSLSKSPGASEKTYTLENLRSIAFGLHQVFGLAGSFAAIIASNLPPESVAQIMAVVDAMFEKIRVAVQDVPDPSAE